MPVKLSATFDAFFASEKSSGTLLAACALVALALANGNASSAYAAFWQTRIAGLSLEHWINDGLMAIFFLFIGLELEREIYRGELSDIRNALLPIVAAVGGLSVPALIHFSFNQGTVSQAGFGIPMATDIAFALAVLAMLGSRIPASLKVFLAALAVIDDLGAIVMIALFYASNFSPIYLAGSLVVFAALVALNCRWHVVALTPYLAGGALMWFLTLKSGVHATVSGVLLAFAIPFLAAQRGAVSPSERLEHVLHKPVAFIVLPLFALANTGVVIAPGALSEMFSSNSLGIIAGLVLGKPVGILLACLVAVFAGVCRLPVDLRWSHVIGAGLLGGIGFTMSIFITNLAFAGHSELVNASKMAILGASVMAAIIGYCWLAFTRKLPADDD